MKYQNCADAPQADGTDGQARRLGAAHINPATGLASDYLNHFNEAIMLLEMLPSCPECRDDFLQWRAKSYTEHFAGSHFKDRALAIAAYDRTDAQVRQSLEALSDAMSAVLEATRAALATDIQATAAAALAERVVTCLRPLITRAGAVINGDADADIAPAPQATVDALMRR